MTMLVHGMMIYVITSMDSFVKRNEYLGRHQTPHQGNQRPRHLSPLMVQQLPQRRHPVLALERKLQLQFVCYY